MKRRDFVKLSGAICTIVPASFFASPTIARADESTNEEPWVEVEEYPGDLPPIQDEDNHLLIETPQSRSASFPASGAIYYLSNGSYSFSLVELGYRLYTNVWLRTTTGTIRVTLSNWTVLEDYGGTNNKVTIRLYNKSHQNVQTTTRTVSPGNTYVTTFHSLNKNTDYCVCFEVTTNGNSYSARGRISQ